MFCKKCGKQLPEGTKFCGACGAPVQPPVGSVPADAQPESRSNPLSREKKILSRSQDQPAPLKKRPSGRKLLPIVGGLAVVILAAVLLFTLFGGKTVYLMTKYVTVTETGKSTTEYGFDKDGNLTEVRYIDNDQPGSYSAVWRYEYEDGRIVSAEYESDDQSFDLEYSYDRDGNLEAIEGDGFEGDISCDKHGRITEMEFEGRFEITIACSYYDNGFPKEQEYTYDVYREKYVYNEAGKLLKYTEYIDDIKSMIKTYQYDSDGRLTKYEIKYYRNDEVYSRSLYTFEYDKEDSIIACTMNQTYDGESMTAEYECTGNDTTREWVVAGRSYDEGSIYSYIPDILKKGDTYCIETYDDAGNLIEWSNYETSIDNKSTLAWEYEAIRVPRDYVPRIAGNTTAFGMLMPFDLKTPSDPRYCTFLLWSLRYQ